MVRLRRSYGQETRSRIKGIHACWSNMRLYPVVGLMIVFTKYVDKPRANDFPFSPETEAEFGV